MLLNRIKADETLSKFIKDRCEDEGICVQIEDKMLIENYLIIKPDDYYNSLNVERRPKSPDCLIIQKCQDNVNYSLTIAELKGGKAQNNPFAVEEIIEKFETCLKDFMGKRFKIYFNRYFKRIDIYLVSNKEIYKQDAGLKIKILQSKRFEYNGGIYYIKPYMPNPAVKICY